MNDQSQNSPGTMQYAQMYRVSPQHSPAAHDVGLLAAPSTTSFLVSEWFPQELQSELSLAMHSLSESESATKRGNASTILTMRFVAIIQSKCQQLLRTSRPTRK